MQNIRARPVHLSRIDRDIIVKHEPLDNEQVVVHCSQVQHVQPINKKALVVNLLTHQILKYRKLPLADSQCTQRFGHCHLPSIDVRPCRRFDWFIC